ncbi:MAG: ADP-ribosylglycohydrolase family protein [Verrucomicrobiota bacterium]
MTIKTAGIGQSDRFRGALLGLAVGDAVGTTLEFKSPGTFEPITDMIGGGPFRLKPGEWTDDTSMALCLAASLIECGRFDERDQMQRYVRWWREGYMSSNGICFDIGNTTAQALAAFQRTGDPFSGSTDPKMAGNGSLMRLAPVPLFFAHKPQEAIERSGDSSRTTHAAQTAIDACRYFGGLLVSAVNGANKETLLSANHCPVPDCWNHQPLHPAVKAVAEGSFKEKQPPKIRGTGYVVDAIEAALWAFNESDSFHEGLLLAVNLGNDADTTGAIYGQIAGAHYGLPGIPKAWQTKVAKADLIVQFGGHLLQSPDVQTLGGKLKGPSPCRLTK